MLAKAAVLRLAGYPCVLVPTEQKKKTKPKQLILPRTNKEKTNTKQKEKKGRKVRRGGRIFFKKAEKEFFKNVKKL